MTINELGAVVTAITALLLALTVLVIHAGRYLRIANRVRREMAEEERQRAKECTARRSMGFKPPHANK